MDYIYHPAPPARLAEGGAAKARLAGADRHAVQAALLPYEHLLPERLRGRNERIDEPLTPAAAAA